MADHPLNLGSIVPNTGPALFPGPESLVGQYVILERLAENHLPDLFENVASHNNLWTWLSDGPFSTASDFDDWMRSNLKIPDQLAVYVVVPLSGPKEGKAVGCFSLFGANLANRVIELGILFGPQLQNTRAATEVVSLVGNLVFDKLKFRRWEWKCHSLNVASKKAAERYGFVYEGTLRQQQILRGRNRDSCWYSIIDSEWPMCRRVFETWLDAGNFDEKGQQKRKMEEVRGSLM